MLDEKVTVLGTTCPSQDHDSQRRIRGAAVPSSSLAVQSERAPRAPTPRRSPKARVQVRVVCGRGTRSRIPWTGRERTVAYLRVSTPQQDVSSQRLAILEYAQKHDLHIDDFIEATASGQASEKRRRARRVAERGLHRGERLIVSELSRDPRRARQGRRRLRGAEGEHPRRG